jgi:hypothetical protein
MEWTQPYVSLPGTLALEANVLAYNFDDIELTLEVLGEIHLKGVEDRRIVSD